MSRVRPLRASAVAWFDEAPTHNRVALTQVAATYGGEDEDDSTEDHLPKRRPCMGPVATPQMPADRFNIFGHDQLRDFGAVVDGVKVGAPVMGGRDYSGGLLQRALGRRAPAHARLNLAAWQVRERLTCGEQWWADIGHRHDPDYAGHE